MNGLGIRHAWCKKEWNTEFWLGNKWKRPLEDLGIKCRNAGGGSRCTAVRDMISAYWQVHWQISSRWNTMTALQSDRNAAAPFAQTQSYTAAEHLSCSLCCLCSCVCAVTSWWPTQTHTHTQSYSKCQWCDAYGNTSYQTPARTSPFYQSLHHSQLHICIAQNYQTVPQICKKKKKVAYLCFFLALKVCNNSLQSQ